MITLNLIPEPFVLIFYCNTGSLLTPPTQRKNKEWLMRKSPLKIKIRKSTIAKSFKVTKWYRLRLTWTVSFCRLWDSSPETEDGLLYHFIQLPVHPRFDSTLDCFAFSVFFFFFFWKSWGQWLWYKFNWEASSFESIPPYEPSNFIWKFTRLQISCPSSVL